MAQILDVGCGFARGVHHKRGEIGVDLNRGMCDIVADAHYLPFRPETFDKVLLYAILEHLDDPIKCLKECIKVSKTDAHFEIVIPVDARLIVVLKQMIFGFPWGVLRALKSWWRWSIKFRKMRRFETPHKSCIQPRHISHLLKIEKIDVLGNIHPWFLGRKGKLLRMFIKNPPRIGMEKSWYIRARNLSRKTNSPLSF